MCAQRASRAVIRKEKEKSETGGAVGVCNRAADGGAAARRRREARRQERASQKRVRECSGFWGFASVGTHERHATTTPSRTGAQRWPLAAVTAHGHTHADRTRGTSRTDMHAGTRSTAPPRGDAATGERRWGGGGAAQGDAAVAGACRRRGRPAERRGRAHARRRGRLARRRRPGQAGPGRAERSARPPPRAAGEAPRPGQAGPGQARAGTAAGAAGAHCRMLSHPDGGGAKLESARYPSPCDL